MKTNNIAIVAANVNDDAPIENLRIFPENILFMTNMASEKSSLKKIHAIVTNRNIVQQDKVLVNLFHFNSLFCKPKKCSIR